MLVLLVNIGHNRDVSLSTIFFFIISRTNSNSLMTFTRRKDKIYNRLDIKRCYLKLTDILHFKDLHFKKNLSSVKNKMNGTGIFTVSRDVE